MCVVIRCDNKGKNDYVFTISDLDRDDDNVGFEVAISCTILTEELYFKIIYDSFAPDFKNTPIEQQHRAMAWIVIHERKGIFEDAFGKSYYECESDVEFKITEAILPYSGSLTIETYKDSDSLFECARVIKKHIIRRYDLFNIGKALDDKWLKNVDFDLLKKLEEIKKQIIK